MSQADVQLVREVLQRFLRTGELTETSPDFELRDHDIPDAAGVVYRGEDGFADWMSLWAAAWGDWIVEPEDYVEGDGGRVVAILRITASGERSGATLSRRDGIVYAVRGGSIAAMDYYGSADEALAAAGAGS